MWNSGGTICQGSLQNNGTCLSDGTYEGGVFTGRHVQSIPLMFAPGKWVMTGNTGHKFYYKDMELLATGKLTGVQYYAVSSPCGMTFS
jgi:hypothetical protein